MRAESGVELPPFRKLLRRGTVGKVGAEPAARLSEVTPSCARQLTSAAGSGYTAGTGDFRSELSDSAIGPSVRAMGDRLPFADFVVTQCDTAEFDEISALDKQRPVESE